MKKIKNQPTVPDQVTKGRTQERRSWAKIGAFFGLGILFGLVLLIGVARLVWHSKFYPGVKVGGIAVGGLSREQVRVKLNEVTNNYQLKLTFNGSEFLAPKGTIGFENEATLNAAYHYGRRLIIADYLMLLINKTTNYPLLLSEGKTDKFDRMINEIAGAVEIPPVEPQIQIVDGKINVVNGEEGIMIDEGLLNKAVAESAANLSPVAIAVPLTTTRQQLSPEKISELKTRAESLISKNIILSLDDDKFNLGSKELVAFLAVKDQEMFNQAVINDYITGLAQSLNKPPQDAKFSFSEGKVKEFLPGKDGVEVNIRETAEALQQAIVKLMSGEKTQTVQIVASRTAPKVTTEKVNELGIRELIGRGESYYQHSIPNRIFNVALASSRINSALIAPGEEVSFNKLVGEVSSDTGYRQAYIISGGRTVMGDGGGLCQVSTTMFRAAMNAGLPILERWGHAYRVSYYELNSKPGVDATVIAPSKDFRFKNDTPGHILIQTINDPKALHLVIEIYGTSDGRVATISTPKVWGITPPLPTVYQDDPTLPSGVIKQVDWAASGAKASFEYKVTRNGETLQEKTFTTNYQPWASVYLKGTAI